MILQRYILKDIFSHTAAVSLIFLFVVLSSRSIQYLEQVSRGEISVDLVFWIIILRLPEFLQLIIPFGFFLSIILVIGRLYSDSEMIIFEQNGFSTFKFMKIFICLGIFFSLLTGLLSLWVTPIFNEKLEKAYLFTSFEDDFNSLQAGKFNVLDDFTMIYAKEKEDGILKEVFIKFSEKKEALTRSFVTAEKAYLSKENENTLLLEKGFSFYKDKTNKIEMSFDTFALDFNENVSKNNTNRAVKNLSLRDAYDSVELQWRYSIPLLCLISTILAFPLSRVSPRKGRFHRVLPSILVFICYLGLLLLTKGWMEEGIWPLFPGLLLVHGVFLIIGLFLVFYLSRLTRSS